MSSDKLNMYILMSSELELKKCKGEIVTLRRSYAILLKELEDIKNSQLNWLIERGVLMSEHDNLKVKYDALVDEYNNRFIPFKFVCITRDVALDIYMNGNSWKTMFLYFLNKYYINERYPNIFLKEKRTGTYKCYDGKTFNTMIIPKIEIIDKIIREFGMKMKGIVNSTYPSPEYDYLYTNNEDKYRNLIDELSHIESNNRQYINKYYTIFESLITGNHKNIFM